MHTWHRWLAGPFAVGIILVALSPRGEARAQEEFEGWHLEPGISQAHLVMVARVTNVGSVTVVEGAKTATSIRQYRFQPVRLLKGIFQRDDLSMTAGDLGISADGPPPMVDGEFRLLILIQPQGIRSFGCVSAAPGARTFDERVPRLTGPDDPLLGVVETLIRVADSRSRRERAQLLVERLAEVDGLAAVPLLSSLRARADWAATEGRAYDTVARLVGDRSTVARDAAIDVLGEMLVGGTLSGGPRQLDGAAAALHETFESDVAVTRTRLSALDALSGLLESRTDLDWPREYLTARMNTADTHAERAAAADALGRIDQPRAAASVLDALAGLPLDTPADRERVYARAAARLDREASEDVLLDRLRRSIAARQSLEAEIEPLAWMRSERSLPLLLSAVGRNEAGRVVAGPDVVSAVDRRHVARALGRVGDDRAVPALTDWLRGDDYRLKEAALSALEVLDSPLAARESRPLLKSEPNLPFKLRLARLLARHGLDDGYALATEHLADASHTAEATLVLVALEDPRTSGDLSSILESRPDRRWRAAALTGLAAVGDQKARLQLGQILADDRHPLVADAAEAAGLTDDIELLSPLAVLARSRNKSIALASLVAMRRFLSGVRQSPRGLAVANRNDGYSIEADDSIDEDADQPLIPAAEVPAQTRSAIADSVVSLALDAYVDSAVRLEALRVSRRLGGERHARLLIDLADQAELEGTPLLSEVATQRRDLVGRLTVASRRVNP